MKPLPAQNSMVTRVADSAIPSIPSVLSTPVASYSSSNRRAANGSVQRAYPWLLFASSSSAISTIPTAPSTIFCRAAMMAPACCLCSIAPAISGA